MPKKKKKRNLQAKLARERAAVDRSNNMTVSQAREKLRQDQQTALIKSIERGESTRTPLFRGSTTKFAREIGAPFILEQSQSVNEFREYVRISMQFAYKKYGVPGFLAYLALDDYVIYFPCNFKFPEWFRDDSDRVAEVLDECRNHIMSLRPYGYIVSTVVVALGDETAITHVDLAPEPLLDGDRDSGKYDSQFTGHIRQLFDAKIEVDSGLTYELLLHRAITSYNNFGRNYIKDPRGLSFLALKRIITNYIRHCCSNYDETWQSFDDHCDPLHEVLRDRFLDAIDEAYPNINSFIADYLLTNEKVKAKV